MILLNACRNIFDQLSLVLKEIRNEDFAKEVEILNRATIGQHIRHTLEFFICLMQNYEGETINYDLRDHDKLIESDKSIAQIVISQLRDYLNTNSNNKPLILKGHFSKGDSDMYMIDTNFHRELAYNIEHAIHHMAIIKIGLREVAPYIKIKADFGVAASTLRYNVKAQGQL